VVEVQNYGEATLQVAQTTLRSVLGGADLDTLLGERDSLNENLQHIIDAHTEPWGIKVTAVEIKDVEIPERMQHAIARQAEAERERRAKIINAEGEAQAATRLSEAADVISVNPVTIQLRYLQTLREIGAEQNSTIIFPMPLDLIKPLLQAASQAAASTGDQTPDPVEPPAVPEGTTTPELSAAPELTALPEDDALRALESAAGAEIPADELPPSRQR
jgi:regulator of protease activity HflC (stomatin/prohibitin superfamily)